MPVHRSCSSIRPGLLAHTHAPSWGTLDLEVVLSPKRSFMSARYAACCSASIRLSHAPTWFQLARVWSTISKSLILDDEITNPLH